MGWAQQLWCGTEQEKLLLPLPGTAPCKAAVAARLGDEAIAFKCPTASSGWRLYR